MELGEYICLTPSRPFSFFTAESISVHVVTHPQLLLSESPPPPPLAGRMPGNGASVIQSVRQGDCTSITLSLICL